ncbi:MAG: hypothetical protein V1834_01790, partial [Candidatus Micrarchaeota archaeon]
MPEESKPIVIGVRHELNHPTYPQIRDFIRKSVTPGLKVGLELPRGYPADAPGYFNELRKEIIKAGGEPVLIDSHFAGVETGQAVVLTEMVFFKEKLALIKLGQALDKVVKSKASQEEKDRVYTEIAGMQQELSELTTAEKTKQKKAIDKLSALRSKFMLKKILAQDIPVTFMGAEHARHIQEHAPNAPVELLLTTPFMA